MLPVSLNCLFLMTPSDLGCQCLWIVYLWLRLQVYAASVSGLFIHDCPFRFMLPLSLDCLFMIAPSELCCQCLWIVYSSLPLQIYFASVSGLSIHDCPFRFMLPVSLDCLFMIAPSGLCCKCLKSEGAIINRQSRDTGNIYLKGSSRIDNSETLAT
jgi:hypothetical protein